jgi:hypothetical protein
MDTELSDFLEQLKSQDFSAKVISVRGRFHHDVHIDSVAHLAKLCVQDARFRLPDTEIWSPLPLRSNVNGEIIENISRIHEVALESILVKPSLWSLTVSSVIEETQGGFDGQLTFSAIGTDQFVPRLIKNRLVDLPSSSSRLSSNGECGRAEDEATNTQIKTNTSPTALPIAITGMGCRYAQADSPELLWEMLRLGKTAVSLLPNKRFNMDKLAREPKGPFFGNYLANPDVFDHRFFGISAREAEAMDPQQRLLLQVAYESMESAGYCGLKKANLPTDIGCYVGVGSDDYTDNVGSVNSNAFSATGTLQAFNSGRISHFFGWSGPSIVVDTACSSAAVAIHMACKVSYYSNAPNDAVL